MTSDLPLHLRVVAQALEDNGFDYLIDLDEEDMDGFDSEPILEQYRGWNINAGFIYYLYLEVWHPDFPAMWVRAESAEFQIIPWPENRTYPDEIARIAQACHEQNLRHQVEAIDSAKRLIDQALEDSAKASGQLPIPGVLQCSD